MNRYGVDILRLFQVREAIASVSLSHKEDCSCRACRAALGDKEAFTAILEEMNGQQR